MDKFIKVFRNTEIFNPLFSNNVLIDNNLIRKIANVLDLLVYEVYELYDLTDEEIRIVEGAL